MLYRLIIYTTFQITNLVRGDSMLRRKYSDDENSDDDIDVYAKDVRESLLEDDELTPIEEAFLAGYEDAV